MLRGNIIYIKIILPKCILNKIYYLTLHSPVNSGQIIWGATPVSNLSTLCRIENKAFRVIVGTGWWEHASSLYATQKILQLSKLITYAVAKFMLKFTNKKLSVTFNHFFTAVATIHSSCLEIRLSQTNILFSFFILYEFNVDLNLEVQRLGTPFLMTWNIHIFITSSLNSNNFYKTTIKFFCFFVFLFSQQLIISISDNAYLKYFIFGLAQLLSWPLDLVTL